MYMADAILDLRSKDPTAKVDTGPLTALDIRGVPISTRARALFIAVGVIGLVHTTLVWVHLYQLGYPLPCTPRRCARNVNSQPHSHHSERSVYEEPEDYIGYYTVVSRLVSGQYVRSLPRCNYPGWQSISFIVVLALPMFQRTLLCCQCFHINMLLHYH